MIARLYNNIGVCSLGIAFTAQCSDAPLSLTKAFLVMPFISHRSLLDHLARKNVDVANIEKLLVEKTQCFANFNDRFYDGLTQSFNAIQFLVDVELAELNENSLKIIRPLKYDSKMGKRVAKIEKAARNLATILNAQTGHLY